MNRLRGLYAITSATAAAEPERLLTAVAAALRGGCRLLQYRDKAATAAQRRQRAEAVLRLCRAQAVPLIINDDLDLTAAIGADGVHLGAADADPAVARRRLGPAALIGVSCGNSLVRAERAAAAGASYVAFGRFYASQTKPDAPPAELATLQAARQALDLPLCAIGGITPGNAAAVIAAGADLVAAVDGVFGAADVEAAARHYANLF